MIEPMITRKELAKIVKRDVRTVDRWWDKGHLPERVDLNPEKTRFAWLHSDIVAWLESNKRGRS